MLVVSDDVGLRHLVAGAYDTDMRGRTAEHQDAILAVLDRVVDDAPEAVLGDLQAADPGVPHPVAVNDRRRPSVDGDSELPAQDGEALDRDLAAENLDRGLIRIGWSIVVLRCPSTVMRWTSGCITMFSL